MKVFVGCSSYNTIDKKYFDTAIEVSNILISNKFDLIFGCCNSGLMGTVYNEFKKKNCDITAVCTEYYKSDLDNVDCEKILVKDTYNQLNYFEKNSDLYLFLPGGFGTHLEIYYLINSYITKSTQNKIVIINTDGFFNELKSTIRKLETEKFIKLFDFIIFIDKIEELERFMEDLC